MPPPPPPPPPNLSQSGYFAPADPSAPVVPFRPRGSGDPLKKGGRYEEEFLWNTNWQEAWKYDEDLARQKKEAEALRRGDGPSPSPSPHLLTPGGGDKKGFISFRARSVLDDLDVDLSTQLLARPKTADQAAEQVSIQTTPTPSPTMNHLPPYGTNKRSLHSNERPPRPPLPHPYLVSPSLPHPFTPSPTPY